MLDSDVLNFVAAHRTPWLTDVIYVITAAGNTLPVTVITIALAVLLVRLERRSQGLLIVPTMVTSWLAMTALKNAFARERPPMPQRLIEIPSYSFPSGHAMLSATLATIVIALFQHPRKPALPALAVTASLLIGLSRIYLGAHWLTDVLAGWCFGVIWAALFLYGARITSGGRYAAR